ncbi:NAD(P)-binding protein [Luteolibacter sp. GHJ8]|uniref:NAD(P)-binding protein n=1 Tax=Luteolibacter rhizosphaerae TaxID=2989719 RepID=A0ABT3G0C5_9BACT|nr:UDP-galactopyranose mutase [Luteolibacter rhizosphaerae]MCW1912680.1 NAD(P)-binding protein [Luteolibacter rhizosphaerae]
MAKRVLIVGAGFSGAVLARQFADLGGIKSLVIDSRDHIAGNCHTERDAASGIMVHRYGPHIFHTDRIDVWNYVNRFGEFRPFINRVKASIDRGIFSLPVNLHTINQFFGTKLSPSQAREFIESKAERSIGEPANFEEQALKFIGRELYEAFFYGYTRKQWGCEPRELPAAILSRLPVRFNYDDNYYNSPLQGIPAEGYTAVIANILAHENIEVRLGTSFDPAMAGEFDHVFYTGPLDEFFGHRLGRLSYRTVFWEKQEATGDFQGVAVMNYPDAKLAHTRVHEHKHFAPWEKHDSTLAFVEYSKETEATDIPYYPKRLAPDKELLANYAALAREQPGVSFLGRLATYRYMDMHQVIGEALDFAGTWMEASAAGLSRPVFPARSAL